MSHGRLESTTGVYFRNLGDETYKRQTAANRIAAVKAQLYYLLNMWMLATALPTAVCLFVQGVCARRVLGVLALLLGRQVLEDCFQSCITSFQDVTLSEMTDANIDYFVDRESAFTENAVEGDTSGVTDDVG